MRHETLSGILGEAVRKNHVPGAQLALYHHGELHRIAVGVERTGTGKAVTDHSRFPLGSVSKVITAALVMQLVEDGDVDLDSPVSHHLGAGTASPGHPLADVTTRQLLSHTAGLVSDRPLDAPTHSLRRYVGSLACDDRVNAPCTSFSYSNTGYAVAGHLVENVTGQDWWETVESHLCDPTGLDLAFVTDPRPHAADPGLVDGHAVTPDGTAHPVDFHIENALAPAGGVAASATALVDFARAFLEPEDCGLDGDIAAPVVLHEMGRPVPAADPFGLADGWGAGWSLHLAGDRLWYGHDGTLDGATCHLRVDPQGGSALAFTTNGTTGIQAWEDLLVGLRNEGLDVGHYRQTHEAGSTGNPTERAEIAGSYSNGGLMVVVSPSGDSYRFIVENGFEGVLSTGPGSTFSVTADRYGGASFGGRFLTDPTLPTRVTALQYNGRTLRRSAQPVQPNA